MKQILCSPTEPKSIIKRLGRISSKPEKHGVDFMWFAGKKWYGVQRKRFPDDLEASVLDGRLAKEVSQFSSIDQAFLVLEGYGQWTTDGQPMGDYRSLSKEAMFGLLTTFSVLYSVPTYRVRDQSEFVQCVKALKKWTESPDHQAGRSSFDRRPGPAKNKWGSRDSDAWQKHFLQGFEGLGPVQAAAILEHFGGLPMRWTVESPKDFEAIAGIGPVRAQKLWDALVGSQDEA